MILADFRCPDHGVFEDYADGDADFAPCPECGVASPWSPSPVRGRVRIAEVSRGKSDPRPRPTIMDTRSLGEGQDHEEWRAKREAFWEEKRRKEIKELLA